MAPRLGQQFVAVTGNDGLVGGDHVLAALQSPVHQRKRLLLTADQFDDDIDVRLVQGAKIGAEGSAIEIDVGLGRAAREAHEP